MFFSARSMALISGYKNVPRGRGTYGAIFFPPARQSRNIWSFSYVLVSPIVGPCTNSTTPTRAGGSYPWGVSGSSIMHAPVCAGQCRAGVERINTVAVPSVSPKRTSRRLCRIYGARCDRTHMLNHYPKWTNRPMPTILQHTYWNR